jgi:hypothetical protein
MGKFVGRDYEESSLQAGTMSRENVFSTEFPKVFFVILYNALVSMLGLFNKVKRNALYEG